MNKKIRGDPSGAATLTSQRNVQRSFGVCSMGLLRDSARGLTFQLQLPLRFWRDKTDDHFENDNESCGKYRGALSKRTKIIGARDHRS